MSDQPVRIFIVEDERRIARFLQIILFLRSARRYRLRIMPSSPGYWRTIMFKNIVLPLMMLALVIVD